MWRRGIGARRGRVPGRKQHDQADCGAACLSSVAAFYGLSLPIATIRQHSDTTGTGTTVLGLVRAAQALGFSAKGVRANIESLPSVPLPAIAHTVEGLRTHFVVVVRVLAESVFVMDPADGRTQRLEIENFRARWTGVLVILVPSDSFVAGDATTSVGMRFWRLVKPHRAVMLQALVGAALYTALGLSTAVFVQKLVDHVLPDGNRNLLNLMGAALIALLMVQLGIGLLKDTFILRTGQRLDAALVLGYYRHILRLPQSFFDSMRVGEVLSRVNDAVKIRAFINDVAVDLAVSVLVVLFSLGLMTVYSWRLALLVAASLPLYALLYWLANRSNRGVQRRLMESAADLESHLVESIGASSTIRVLSAHSAAEERMENRFVRVLRQVYASARTAILARGLSDTISRFAVVVLLWVGGTMAIRGWITPGELMSFYALAGYLSGPMVALVTANRTLQEALIASDRLFEILDLELEKDIGPVSLGSEPGDIGFERVTFRYGARDAVLSGLDVVIQEGRITGIAGESGCGKSTIVALIQGLFAPDEGRVTFGGHDLRHITRTSLRRVVAAVPQQIHLIGGSIVDNIAFGDRTPDLRRVLQVCEELGIAGFVERLPDGYRTQLGENGVRLSGGQRQRIAIARALYRQPRVLLLDEATSSLDPESERFVLEAVERFRGRGGTVLLVAHRLSTLRTADTIVVLESGRISETGSHDDLVLAGGGYQQLWDRQTRGYVEAPRMRVALNG